MGTLEFPDPKPSLREGRVWVTETATFSALRGVNVAWWRSRSFKNTKDADRKEKTPSCVGGKKPVEKEYSLYRYVNARAIIVMPACDVVEIYFQ